MNQNRHFGRFFNYKYRKIDYLVQTQPLRCPRVVLYPKTPKYPKKEPTHDFPRKILKSFLDTKVEETNQATSDGDESKYLTFKGPDKRKNILREKITHKDETKLAKETDTNKGKTKPVETIEEHKGKTKPVKKTNIDENRTNLKQKEDVDKGKEKLLGKHNNNNPNFSPFEGKRKGNVDPKENILFKTWCQMVQQSDRRGEGNIS